MAKPFCNIAFINKKLDGDMTCNRCDIIFVKNVNNKNSF